MQPGAHVAPPEVPGYETLQPIAAGGMAQVFLARQRNLERLVAIKFLAPQSGAGDGEQRLRFEREARLMAQVSHPNVVAVFDRGTAAGRDYLVMEYVEGVSLRALLDVGVPQPAAQARRILREVALALAHLHGRGIIHRDVKPENVLVSRNGTVRVTDFGIAFLAGEEGVITHSGQAVGTLDYMAPEQRSRLPVDARADQFTLAVMAYEMLTGRRPLGTVKPPSRLNPALDPRVDEVLLKALRQDREDRYPSVPAFAEALDKALGQAPRQRKPPAAAVLLVAGLVVGLGAGLVLPQVFRPGRTEPRTGTAGISPEPVQEPRPTAPDSARPAPKPAAPDLKTLVKRAKGHAARGRHQEAVAALDEAIRLSPKDPALLARRGEVYFKLKEYPLALEDLNAALERDPENAAALRYRGLSYWQTQRLAEAARDLEAAVALAPNSVHSWKDLGTVYWRLGEHDKAIRAANRAMEVDPKFGYPYFLRGLAYQSLGDDRKACDDYLQAVTLAPDRADFHRALADLLVTAKDRSLRDSERAVRHAWKAYDLTNGNDSEVLRTLATACAAVGDRTAAVRWCKRALELAPPGARKAVQGRLDYYVKRAGGGEATKP
jgi:tetratricopeptide (TPR) repeat protein